MCAAFVFLHSECARFFQQSKWDSLLYSVWCDSLALLTHPETCWMQPLLFAVLPSSTAPSTVAKQPT